MHVYLGDLSVHMPVFICFLFALTYLLYYQYSKPQQYYKNIKYLTTNNIIKQNVYIYSKSDRNRIRLCIFSDVSYSLKLLFWLDKTHRTNMTEKPFNISQQLNIYIMGGKPNPRNNNTEILFQNPSKKWKYPIS